MFQMIYMISNAGKIAIEIFVLFKMDSCWKIINQTNVFLLNSELNKQLFTRI